MTDIMDKILAAWDEDDHRWRGMPRDQARIAKDLVKEIAAKIAEKGCLVPPDGGSPTEDERIMCENIALSIRAL